MKTPLIDDIIEMANNDDTLTVFVGNKWHIAKPLIKRKFITRLKEAWLVLTDKAYVFHYIEDDKEVMKDIDGQTVELDLENEEQLEEVKEEDTKDEA